MDGSIKELIAKRNYEELRTVLFKLEGEKYLEGKELKVTEGLQKEILAEFPFEELANLCVIFAQIKRSGPSLILLESLVQDELNKKWDEVMNEDAQRAAKRGMSNDKA
jgi:hypothetical protein